MSLVALPSDLLFSISDFLRSHVLSCVSHALREILQGRHVICIATPRNCKDLVPSITTSIHKAVTIDATFLDCPTALLKFVEALPGTTLLRHLVLDATMCRLGQVAEGIVLSIQQLPVTSLSLGFARTNIQGVMGGGSGPILAQLGHMEFLTSLNLDVSNGSHPPAGDFGAEAVAALRKRATLKTLAVNLGGNRVTVSGARRLAQLKESPSLESITLTLDNNKDVGDDGGLVLATLLEAPQLTSLTLHLQRCGITPDGAVALRNATAHAPPVVMMLFLDAEAKAL